VRWAIETGGAPVRSAVRDAFADALERLRAEPLPAAGEVELAAFHDHGRLTPSEERGSWLAAAGDVIEPRSRDLIG
jgi:hypothetical protein